MTRYDEAAWTGARRLGTTTLRVPIRKADERPTGGDGQCKRLTPQQIANLLANRKQR